MNNIEISKNELQTISVTLTEYMLSDKDFKKAYNKANATVLSTYKECVNDHVAYVIENIDKYILSKKYIDISWLIIGNECILDMDAIFDIFVVFFNETK